MAEHVREGRGALHAAREVMIVGAMVSMAWMTGCGPSAKELKEAAFPLQGCRVERSRTGDIREESVVITGMYDDLTFLVELPHRPGEKAVPIRKSEIRLGRCKMAMSMEQGQSGPQGWWDRSTGRATGEQ